MALYIRLGRLYDISQRDNNLQLEYGFRTSIAFKVFNQSHPDTLKTSPWQCCLNKHVEFNVGEELARDRNLGRNLGDFLVIPIDGQLKC